MPPRILVFGAGSLGGCYVYILDQAGAEVTAVCRSNYAAVKERGFRIRSTHWGEVQVKPSVIQTVSEAKDSAWDFVVVCTKALPDARPSTVDLIRPAIGPSTALVLIQNGIGIEHEYASAFPHNPLLSCVAYLPATQLEPGVISHIDMDLLHIGTHPATAGAESKRAAAAFAALITRGGATAQLHDDVQTERWSKLVLNAAWNPMCALARCADVEFINSSPDAIKFVRDVFAEVIAIAQAAGYQEINTESVEAWVDITTARKPPGVWPSMMKDALAGRTMEVEAILGNATRIARTHGVESPRLDTLYVLAKALDVAGVDRKTSNMAQF